MDRVKIIGNSFMPTDTKQAYIDKALEYGYINSIQKTFCETAMHAADTAFATKA